MTGPSSAEFDALVDSALHRAGVVAREPEERLAFGASDYLVRFAQRDPQAFQRWLDRGEYRDLVTPQALKDRVSELRARFVATDMGRGALPQLQRVLRSLRADVQRLLIWQHLNRTAPYTSTVANLTEFADAMVQLALEWAMRICAQREGSPQDSAGNPQMLVVFALGKMGGGELNLSSDIDLICCYPEPGVTSIKGTTNQQYFVSVVQTLIKLLSEVTADGFVFRVDLRLRPFGDSGALVTNFSAFERYYESNGRDWERYALIKARACAGDIAAGEDLLARLQPFIYRRYLDFAAIDALRRMRALIQKGQQSHTHNIKLGAGGIRDIEFFVQMLQLIWGGREPTLRAAPLVQALAALVDLGLLQDDQRAALWKHYCLFRDVEHVLQALRDEQTHTLPCGDSDSEKADQVRLSQCLGYADYEELTHAIDAARAGVSQLLEQWLVKPAEPRDSVGAKLWFDEEMPAGLIEELPGRVLLVLAELRRSAARSDVAAVGRERLDALMPILLDDLLTRRSADAPDGPVGEASAVDALLLRVVPLLQNVLRRSAYLVVLWESVPIRGELLDLCVGGGYFPDLLARHPALLDELLLANDYKQIPNLGELRAELELSLPTSVQFVPEQEHFDALVQFKCQHQFRALLAFVRAELDVLQLGDYLSCLAELVIERLLSWAWAGVATESRVGEWPVNQLEGFAVIAYGKLGSFELNSHSDLDLVFVHDWPSAQHGVLHKLVRRFLNYIGMRTYFGVLYEVDIRLRPAGRAGNLVTSLAGLRRYQQESAWVWEHQALMRARPVAGCPSLSAQFEELRREVLSQARDLYQTQREVVAMRERMLAAAKDQAKTEGGATRARDATQLEPQAGQNSAQPWDLKKDVGGIVDIEFMVQYLVLVHAQKFPGLAEHSDNVQTLKAACELGLLPVEHAQQLSVDYQALRTAAQLIALRDEGAWPLLANFDLPELRARVRGCWQSLMVAEI